MRIPLFRGTLFTRIILASLIPVLLIFAVLLVMVSNTIFENNAEFARDKMLDSIDYAVKLTSNKFLDISHLVTMTGENMLSVDRGAENAKEVIHEMLLALLTSHDDIYCAYFVFEPGVFGPERYTKDYIMENGTGSIVEIFDLTDEQLDDPAQSPWFDIPFRTEELYIDVTNKYDFGTGEGTVYVCTVGFPMVEDGEVIGIVSVDILHNALFQAIDSMGDGSVKNVHLISASGTFLYPINDEYFGKNLSDIPFENLGVLTDAIENNKTVIEESYPPLSGEKSLIYLHPLAWDNASETMFLYIDLPTSSLYRNAYTAMGIIIVVGILGMALLAVSLFFTIRNVVRPIKRLTENAEKISLGHFDVEFEQEGENTMQDVQGNEIAVLERSLNTMMHELSKTHEIEISALAARFEKEKAEAMLAKAREADERTQIMLDKTPLCCQLVHMDLRPIDCNKESIRLFELRDRHEYMERFYEIFPEYQPDGRITMEKALEVMDVAMRESKYVGEWMFRIPNSGELIPCEITLVSAEREGENIIASYIRDLREHNKMMREIEIRDNLRDAVNTMAWILLETEQDDFMNTLNQSLISLAQYTGAGHVSVWRSVTNKQGKLAAVRYAGIAAGMKPDVDISGIELEFAAYLPEWENEPRNDINVLGCNLNENLRNTEMMKYCKSLLIMPLHMHGKFWGFMAFEHQYEEYLYSEAEKNVLRSGGGIIVSAIVRHEIALDLHAAVNAAQAASRAKGNFLSNMSHEIRTPMNAIIGMTAIGKKTSDASQKDYAFGKIEDASNHLLGVINDVLDMSKIEADKFELSDVEFDFEKIVQRAVTVVTFRVDEKRQRFNVRLDPNIPQLVIGDDQRFAQVITNLLSNAVKFTPEEGSIWLETRLLKEEDGVCFLQIEVGDTGIGISEEQQSRLFQSFEQAESSISRKYGGTGLGLVISKHIIEQMGGHIRIESALDKGAVFIFTIQFKRGAEKSHSLLNPGVNWNNVRVLAVDDEQETREYITELAKWFQITCDTAAGGEEAINLIETANHYDIYFVDWKMPGMNGIELSRRIKARCESKSVIIMISATAWNEIENDAKEAGVDGFLHKPLFPAAIADCINKCIGADNTPAAAAEKPDEAQYFQGYRILLAEDVEINCEIVYAMLEPTGIAIDRASNGKEAVHMFSKAPESYDLIFMDIQMPEMDGLQATRHIRSLGFPKAQEIPIIAMTANVFREDIEQCLEAGMNEHVGKPIDFDEMMDKLELFLQRRI